jgi:hypothetical protein
MKINIYSIFPLLISLFILFLGIFVYIKQSKSATNRAFSRFSILTFIWLFSYGISYSASTEQQAILWLKIGYTAVILLPVAFFHISYAFLNLSRKGALIFLYGASMFFIYFLHGTNYLVDSFYKYFWGFYPKAGLLHPVYLAFFVVTVSACDTLLFLKWFQIRNETSLYKQKLQYILFAFAVCTIATVDFIPNYGIVLYPFGWIFIALFCSIIAYAIVRYRLMDTSLIIKRTMAYSLSAGFLMGLFVVMVLTTTRFVFTYTEADSFIISIFAALIIALLFNPIRNRIQTLIDKLFYRKTYDYYDTIQKISHDLATTFNVNEIYSLVADKIFSTVGLKSIFLFSAVPREDFGLVYERSFGKKDKSESVAEKYGTINILRDSDLIQFFSKSNAILIKDELVVSQDRYNPEVISDVERTLRPFKGEAVVPVFVDDHQVIFFLMRTLI